MKRTGLALLTCLAAAACGTTVPAAQLRGATATGDGLSVDSGTTGGAAPTDALPDAPTTTATQGGALSSTTGGTTTGITAPTSIPSRSAGPLPTRTAVSVLSGRGFTKDVVKIGVATADDSQAAVNSFGLKGLNPGDYHAQLNAVVADINSHGGLGGRRVQLVIHDYNTTQLLNDPSAANQSACATWTQDNKVLAVLMPPTVTDNLLLCLKKAHTPLINAGPEFPRTYSTIYSRYPDYFHVSAMSGELFDTLAMSRLKARGFFSGWNTVTGAPGNSPVKVGIIVRNDADGATQERSYVRALAAVGIKAASIDHCTSGIASACMQNVELRYQTNHITHVVGNSELTFMNTAQTQNYHPRYFLPGILDTFAQNAPAAQLKGSMAEGFMPGADVPATKDPGPTSVAATQCLTLMRKAHQDVTVRAAALSMETVCDAFDFLVAAVKVHGGLTDDAVSRGMEALGSTVPSALTWSTFLGPKQHAAVSGLRDLAFDEPCKCFGYTSKTTYTH